MEPSWTLVAQRHRSLKSHFCIEPPSWKLKAENHWSLNPLPDLDAVAYPWKTQGSEHSPVGSSPVGQMDTVLRVMYQSMLISIWIYRGLGIRIARSAFTHVHPLRSWSGWFWLGLPGSESSPGRFFHVEDSTSRWRSLLGDVVIHFWAWALNIWTFEPLRCQPSWISGMLGPVERLGCLSMGREGRFHGLYYLFDNL